MAEITDWDGTTAAEWLAKLQKRITNQRATGTRHDRILKAHQAEWVSEMLTCERRYFVVHQGEFKDGTVKRWYVTCYELSERHQRKVGKRWRIEASLLSAR